MTIRPALLCLILLHILPGQYVLCHAHEDANSPDHQHAKPIVTTRQGARMIPPPTAEDVFHFVIYGDRTGGVPEGLKVLEKAVVDTNLLDPDLVMTVGDLIQGYNQTPEWLEQMQEYQDIMQNLNMEWFPVAGNHDVYWRGQDPAPQGHHESNYEKHFGPLWYSFEHKNSAFIVLYSDEGDPQTNLKAFNVGPLQNMSDEQLQFLDKALAKHADQEHVFVFLHHPRWIGGGYTGSNWDVVHKKLVEAGNVTAVFAGHIHHMRYDGPTDGIEYYALATTGGNLSAEIPDAGFLHHLNMISVRETGISVSAIPIGGVIDPKEFTPEFLAEVAAARKLRAVQESPALTLNGDGSAAGQVKLVFKNPSTRTLASTIMPAPSMLADGWSSSLRHQHFEIPPGQTKTIEFVLHRAANVESNGMDELGNPSVPAIRMEVEMLGETSRVRLPDVLTRLDVQPGQVPADYFTTDNKKCLLVRKESDAIRIRSADIALPNGPMTLEAWIQPSDLTGYNGVVAKTENSEYAIFSDEGVPEFSINLGGKYCVVKATHPMKVGTWSHVAGTFDGENVRLFVDGKLVDDKQRKGKRRTNRLPLMIGADVGPRAQATRHFQGKIDEVRLSRSARYEDNFVPTERFSPDENTALLLHLDRSVGPFVLDHSENAVTGLLGEASRLVPR